jgi:hypothetical protein
MLHKLIDTLSGAEVISDDKWLPIYKRRKEMQYIGPLEENTATEAVAEVTEDTTTKRKKSKQ